MPHGKASNPANNQQSKRRNYITRPNEWSDYITRSDEMERFFRRLRKDSGGLNSVEVLGTRSAGVTDFLKRVHYLHVSDPVLSKQLSNVIMVYVDLDSVRNPMEFLSAIVKATHLEIKEILIKPLVNSLKKELLGLTNAKVIDDLADCLISNLLVADIFDGTTIGSFNKWMNDILTKFNKAHFAFLLDGFDQIYRHRDQFEAEFLDNLRALARKNPLCWVVGTHIAVLDICKAFAYPGLIVSEFYNIISGHITLSTLDEKEAKSLIDKWAKSRGVEISVEEAQAIQEIAGPWPRILNAAADYWTEMREHEGCKVEQEMVIKELLFNNPDIAGYILSYLQDLSKQQIENLHAIVNDQELLPQVSLTPLEKLGIVKNVDQKKRITSRLFEEWIRLDLVAYGGAQQAGGNPQANPVPPSFLPEIDRLHQLRVQNLLNLLQEDINKLGTVEVKISKVIDPNAVPLGLESIRESIRENIKNLLDQLKGYGVDDELSRLNSLTL